LVCYWFSSAALADNSINVPILTYHNFDPSVPGSMTISTAQFEAQLKWLKKMVNGYSLKTTGRYLEGKSASLPEKSV